MCEGMRGVSEDATYLKKIALRNVDTGLMHTDFWCNTEALAAAFRCNRSVWQNGIINLLRDVEILFECV